MVSGSQVADSTVWMHARLTMTAKRTHEKQPIPGSLGDIVRGSRKKRGWSQEHLAEVAGIDQNDVSRVETGKSKNPQEQTLLAIARALDIPLGVLYERTHYPEVSYLIPAPREAAKPLAEEQQDLLAHLARFIKQHAVEIKDRDPQAIVDAFARAIAEMPTPDGKASDEDPISS